MPRTKPATKILEIATGHIGEAYVLGARAPLSNSAWKGPWDCAEFASWCVYQASGIIFGAEPDSNPMLADAYTGYWAEHAEVSDASVSVDEALRIPGAMLLRVPLSRRMGHIAISDGKGGTIEAHSTKRGVIAGQATGRRWDYGIIVPGIEYHMSDVPVPQEPPPDILRLTTVMMRGPRVRKIQQRLNKLGYQTGKADGIYGPQTAYAVGQFQNDQGLVADGEVGPETLSALGLA